jgi:hypothetical protein
MMSGFPQLNYKTNMPQSFRKSLCAPELLKTVRRCFEGIPDPVASRGITQTDCLMSGLAVFGLKYPSLLQFDKNQNEPLIQANLQALYGVARAPCDTTLRERLDTVNPEDLREAYRRVLALFQPRQGGEGLGYIDGPYRLSVHGNR